MPYISNQTLQTVKELIYEKNVEMCGNLLRQSDLANYNITTILPTNELLLYIENAGEKSFCMQQTYTKYYWHTHSKYSKGYPSAEDIFVPLRKIPDTSIIFTVWGIWELHTQEKYAYELTKEKRENLKYNYIQKVLDKIYEHTESGRGNLTEKQYSAVLQLVNSLNKLMEKLGYKLTVYFTHWENITNNYILRG